MPAYETVVFDPAAPVARALVRGPTGERRVGVPLLLDSGADVTLLPRQLANDVGAPIQAANIPVFTYSGSELICDVVELSIEVFRYRFQGAFLVTEAEIGVLGRDILNLLVLTLDGPREFWTVS